MTPNRLNEIKFLSELSRVTGEPFALEPNEMMDLICLAGLGMCAAAAGIEPPHPDDFDEDLRAVAEEPKP